MLRNRSFTFDAADFPSLAAAALTPKQPAMKMKPNKSKTLDARIINARNQLAKTTTRNTPSSDSSSVATPPLVADIIPPFPVLNKGVQTSPCDNPSISSLPWDPPTHLEFLNDIENLTIAKHGKPVYNPHTRLPRTIKARKYRIPFISLVSTLTEGYHVNVYYAVGEKKWDKQVDDKYGYEQYMVKCYDDEDGWNDVKRVDYGQYEAKTHAKASSQAHPNILTFMLSISYPERLYLISEYPEFGTLADVIESASVPEKALCWLQVAAGISYLHQIGIFHR